MHAVFREAKTESQLLQTGSCEHLRQAFCGIRQGPERFEKICLENFLARQQLPCEHTISIRSKQLRPHFSMRIWEAQQRGIWFVHT